MKEVCHDFPVSRSATQPDTQFVAVMNGMDAHEFEGELEFRLTIALCKIGGQWSITQNIIRFLAEPRSSIKGIGDRSRRCSVKSVAQEVAGL